MAKKLWGGRFKKRVDREFEELSKSVHYDYKLAEYDIYHSKIHTLALRNRGILTKAESNKIISGLEDILQEIKRSEFNPDLSCEDVHTEIQNRLEKKIGKPALKLHTLRSRNDQIVFDEKWYCLEEGANIKNLLLDVLESLKFLAKRYEKQYFVGYTHTQRAQVILFSSYISAFYDMFSRDIQRLKKFLDSLVIYIGAGALGGSSLRKEDYDKAIKGVLRGKCKVVPVVNPLDNVSDRDFIIEFLCILSILQMHLSRLAEDFILYSTREFNFFDLPEELCSGSSLMPHKKNPDFLELVRGYTGVIYGNLISLLTTMKGLPLAYNRDMQIDKEPLFSSIKIVKDELKIMAKFIKKIRLNATAIGKILEDESLYATELAEYLVYKNVPFQEAHTIVGRLIRYAEDKNIKIKEMPDKLLKNFHNALDRKVVGKIMNPKYAILSKKTFSQKPPKLK